MRAHPFFLSAVLLLAASHALASTFNVTDSGVFSSSTPLTAFSAPGESFLLSFQVQSTPAVSGVTAGSDFNIAYTDFSYLINGSAVSTPPASITFYSGSSGGLFRTCFLSACPATDLPLDGLVFAGAQAYAGSESAPTILAGSYTPLLAGGFFDGSGSAFASESNITIAAVTPEPSTLTLLGTGLLGVMGIARRRFGIGSQQ